MALTYRQRFYCKIKPYSSNDECHIWDGTKDDAGYGIFAGKRAHRVAWELECSEIPEGLVVRHFVCDNKACVNIKHLKIGTHLDNMQDMLYKKRHPVDNDKIYSSMIQHEILVNQLKLQIKSRRGQRSKI